MDARDQSRFRADLCADLDDAPGGQRQFGGHGNRLREDRRHGRSDRCAAYRDVVHVDGVGVPAGGVAEPDARGTDRQRRRRNGHVAQQGIVRVGGIAVRAGGRGPPGDQAGNAPGGAIGRVLGGESRVSGIQTAQPVVKAQCSGCRQRGETSLNPHDRAARGARELESEAGSAIARIGVDLDLAGGGAGIAASFGPGRRPPAADGITLGIEGIGDRPRGAGGGFHRSGLGQGQVARRHRIHPIEVARRRQIQDLGLYHRKRVPVGVPGGVRRCDSRRIGIIEREAGDGVGVVDPHRVTEHGTQNTTVAAGRRRIRAGGQCRGEHPGVGTSLRQRDILPLAGGRVRNCHRKRVDSRYRQVLVAVGHTQPQRLALGEIDICSGKPGVEELHLAIGDHHCRGRNIGRRAVVVFTRLIAAGDYPPVGRVVDPGCVGRATATGEGVDVFGTYRLSPDNRQRAAVAGSCCARGRQQSAEHPGGGTGLHQGNRLELPGYRIGNGDRHRFSKRAVAVLVRIPQLDADAVADVVAGGLGNEGAVHQDDLPIGHVRRDLGLVDLVLLHRRAGHGHAVGDHVVVVRKGLVDAAADLHPVGHLDHAAAMQPVYRGGTGVHVDDAVACAGQREAGAGKRCVGGRRSDCAIGVVVGLGRTGNAPQPAAGWTEYRQDGAVRNVGRAVGRRDAVFQNDVEKVDDRAIGQAHRVGDLLADFDRCIVVTRTGCDRRGGFRGRLGELIVRERHHGGAHVEERISRARNRGILAPGCRDQGAIRGIHGQAGLVLVRIVEDAVGLEPLHGKLPGRTRHIRAGHDGPAGADNPELGDIGDVVDAHPGVAKGRHPHRAAIGRCREAWCRTGRLVVPRPPRHHELVGQIGFRDE